MKFSVLLKTDGRSRINNMIMVSESFEDERILQHLEQAVREMALVTIEHVESEPFQFRFGKVIDE